MLQSWYIFDIKNTPRDSNNLRSPCITQPFWLLWTRSHRTNFYASFKMPYSSPQNFAKNAWEFSDTRIPSLKLTAITPRNKPNPLKKDMSSFQWLIFRDKLTVSFREGVFFSPDPLIALVSQGPRSVMGSLSLGLCRSFVRNLHLLVPYQLESNIHIITKTGYV